MRRRTPLCRARKNRINIRAILFAICAQLSAVGLMAAESPLTGIDEHTEAGEGVSRLEAEGKSPFAVMLERARKHAETGRLSEAEAIYVRLLESRADPDKKKDLLIELAEINRLLGALGRAFNLLEQFIKLHPEDPRHVETIYRAGLLLADMGLREKAITFHYRVLNRMMTLNEEDMEEYRTLARLSQYEIARNYFYQAEYKRALLLFERVGRYELEPGDRETVTYYLIRSQFGEGNYEEAIQATDAFAEEFHGSDLLPELLYLKARSLHISGSFDEALETLFVLLDIDLTDRDRSSPSMHWRRLAGNRFANRFYEKGDYEPALRLYQTILTMSDDPRWTLPIVYQIGLCFERLGQPERAAQAYAYLVEKSDGWTEGEEWNLIMQLRASAEWRLDALRWKNELRKRVESLAAPG